MCARVTELSMATGNGGSERRAQWAPITAKATVLSILSFAIHIVTFFFVSCEGLLGQYVATVSAHQPE